MSWEEVEQMPGAQAGAYRSEPVVAERRGLRPLEWVRAYWGSPSARPFSHTVQHAVLTSEHVYVERRDGARSRAPIDELCGERREHGQVIYGVGEGEELWLPDRPECSLQRRLSQRAAGATTRSAWTRTEGLGVSLVLIATSAAMGAFSAVLLSSDPIPLTPPLIEAGSWLTVRTMSELGLGLFALLVFLWGPSRWRIDQVGVTLRRGVIPWLAFEVPAERVEFVRLVHLHALKTPDMVNLGLAVVLGFERPVRVGTVWRTSEVVVQRFLDRRRWTGETPAQAGAALCSQLEDLLSLGPAKDGPVDHR